MGVMMVMRGRACTKKALFFLRLFIAYVSNLAIQYRECVKHVRRQILIELLGKSGLENHAQEVSGSRSCLSQDEEKELSRRNQFNARVSGMLKSRARLIERADLKRVPVWQRDMSEFGDLRTDTVLLHLAKNNAQTKRSCCTPPVYIIKKVEASVCSQYELHAPRVLGPDMDGELGKRFLTYYTFTSQTQGESNEKPFYWESMRDKQFSVTRAYPEIGSRRLHSRGWSLRVPKERTIQHAASLSYAVRGKSIRDAIDFLRGRDENGSAEEMDIAK